MPNLIDPNDPLIKQKLDFDPTGSNSTTSSKRRNPPPGYYSMPRKFDVENWLQRVHALAPIPEEHKLPAAAEALIAQSLDSMREKTSEYIYNEAIDIVEGNIASDTIYQVETTKTRFENSHNQKLLIINETLSSILDSFQNDSAFKEKFSKSMNVSPEEALKALRVRLKYEQDLTLQEAVEKELSDAIEERIIFANAAQAAADARVIVEGDDFAIKEGVDLSKIKNVSFIPGKGKSFNFFDAFFRGVWHATIYNIREDGVHVFNPHDPDARKTFYKLARGQNDGKTTVVTIRLGAGTSAEYAMYSKMSPDISKRLHTIAMENMAVLKYCFDEIPDKSLTKESIMAYYNKTYYNNYKTLAGLPQNLANLDLTVSPIPFLEFKDGDKTNFNPTPADKAEFKRWEGIREALIACRIDMINQKASKNEITADELTTLKTELEKAYQPKTLEDDEQHQPKPGSAPAA